MGEDSEQTIFGIKINKTSHAPKGTFRLQMNERFNTIAVFRCCSWSIVTIMPPWFLENLSFPSKRLNHSGEDRVCHFPFQRTSSMT